MEKMQVSINKEPEELKNKHTETKGLLKLKMLYSGSLWSSLYCGVSELSSGTQSNSTTEKENVTVKKKVDRLFSKKRNYRKVSLTLSFLTQCWIFHVNFLPDRDNFLRLV